MKLIQLSNSENSRIVGVLFENKIFNITEINKNLSTTYELINYSLSSDLSLENIITNLLLYFSIFNMWGLEPGKSLLISGETKSVFSSSSI